MDHAVLAEGAEHAHRAVVAARAGDREALAGQVALEDRGAHVADRLLAGRAVAAGAAVGDERADHVVAGLDPGDARADLLDDPGALVAEHHRQPGLEVAVRDVHVGVAQPGVGVADQHLAVLRAVEVEFLDLDRLAGLVDDCGLGLHHCPPRGLGLTYGSVKSRRSPGAPTRPVRWRARLPVGPVGGGAAYGEAAQAHLPRNRALIRIFFSGTGAPCSLGNVLMGGAVQSIAQPDLPTQRTDVPAEPPQPARPPLVKFHAPEVVFGLGSLGEAGFSAARLGARRPMVVTDPGIIEAGWCDELVGHLREARLHPGRLVAGHPEPQGPRDPRRLRAVRRAGLRRADRPRRRLLHRRGQGRRDPVRQRRPDPATTAASTWSPSRSRRC